MRFRKDLIEIPFVLVAAAIGARWRTEAGVPPTIRNFEVSLCSYTLLRSSDGRFLFLLEACIFGIGVYSSFSSKTSLPEKACATSTFSTLDVAFICPYRDNEYG